MLALRMIEPPVADRSSLVWSVAGLVKALSDTLQSRFAAVVVRGELSGFSRAASGHCYFGLKDAEGHDAMLRGAMFRRAASLLDFAPADGMAVEVRGRVALYEPRGDLQLIVESMTRAGAGALMEQFLKLKAKLEREGLFDAARKRPLPAFPRRVGVVTSLGAAALRDVCAAFARRAPHVELVVYPSPVQGADAPPALVRALAEAAARAEVELLLLCRGGGSLEDLWAFNDERVVRAVAASPIPVVCGVGHETDVTLADFAADLRAPTPTAAAELAAPARDDLLQALAALAARARRSARQRLERDAQRLDHVALRIARPADALQRHRHALELIERRFVAALDRRVELQRRGLPVLAARMRMAVPQRLRTQRDRLDGLAARLALLDPRQVMARGYAWVTGADGRAIVSARQLSPGASLRASWHDGEADASVTRVHVRD